MPCPEPRPVWVPRWILLWGPLWLVAASASCGDPAAPPRPAAGQAHGLYETGGTSGATPTAAFSVVTTSPIATAPVTFDATASTTNDTTTAPVATLSYSWTFGDGTLATSSTPKGTTHDYSIPGTYTVTLTVTGSNSGFSASTSHSVTVGQRLGAGITAAIYPIRAGLPATLMANPFPATAADSTAVWNWTFGDGTTAQGPTVVKTFPTAGPMAVTLTVQHPGAPRAILTDSIRVAPAGPAGVGGATLWIMSGTGVTLDSTGYRIARIADQSGYGNDAVQTTASLRPYYTAGVQAGWPAIGYDEGQVLTHPDTSMPGTVFLVGRNKAADWRAFLGMMTAPGQPNTASDAYELYGNVPSANTQSQWQIVTASNNGAYAVQNRPSYSQDNGFMLLVATTTAAGATTLSIDGASPATAGAPAGTLLPRTGPGSIGAGYYNHTLTDYLQGDIVEVIIFPTILSTANQTAITGYLAQKYALTVAGAPAPPGAPTPVLTVGTSAPAVGVPIPFRASGSTAQPGRQVARYAWSYGDGGTALGQNAPHTYTTAGTYTVGLTVADDAGAAASTSATVTVH